MKSTAKIAKDIETHYKNRQDKPLKEQFDDYTGETAKKKFKNPELILEIHKEISKEHLMDDAGKLTTFLVCGSSYLEPSELHKSQASKGSRSVGKDNMFHKVLKHFPKEDWLFLTRGTQATMEDDITNYKIIIYSEVNLGKDDKGANAQLVEVLKQLTEGGTSALKKKPSRRI